MNLNNVSPQTPVIGVRLCNSTRASQTEHKIAPQTVSNPKWKSRIYLFSLNLWKHQTGYFLNKTGNRCSWSRNANECLSVSDLDKNESLLD